jgi:tripartite-type tricarboxylate transporter receptor subunit TctC
LNKNLAVSLVYTALACACAPLHAQPYPSKIVRIISPGPGGDTDFKARLVAPAMSTALGQQVIVENRPAGVISPQLVSKSAPDGYTLLMAGPSVWTGPFFENVGYDPVADLSPITFMATSPSILVVHPSVPVKTVKGLIALAKARPGDLNYGSGATGASTHLAAELFKYLAKVDIVRVRYKTGAQRINGLLGGEVHVNFESAGALSYVKAGRLRALAVSTPEPTELAPGLPTLAAAGVPGYLWEGMSGMFAPAKTPAPVIERLHQEVARALANPEIKAKLFAGGEEVVGRPPDQFAPAVKSEMARLGKMIKDAGLREQQ